MQEMQNVPQEFNQPEQATALSLIMTINPQMAVKSLKGIAGFQAMVNQNLVDGQDYGVIPGTNKPTLLKPGAEKILMLLRLQSQYTVTDKVENWDEGFFAYTVRATLVHNGEVITQGLGAANTKETRYQLKAWDDSQHKKVWDGSTYQDPYTLQNTVLKMAKKRAQVDAALTVGSLSNIFTQDMEDMKDFTKAEQAHTAATGTTGDMKITFGKHQGETISQIGSTEEGYGYLEWLSKNARQEDVKSAALAFLSKPSGNQPAQQQPQPQQQATARQQQTVPQPPAAPGTPVDMSDEELNNLFGTQSGTFGSQTQGETMPEPPLAF